MRRSRSVGAGFATIAGVAAVVLYPTSAHSGAPASAAPAATTVTPLGSPPAPGARVATPPPGTAAAPPAPSTAPPVPAAAASTSAPPASPRAATPSATTRPAPAPAAPPAAAAPAPVSGTFTGKVAQTSRGPVQVQITVTAGRITAANAIQHPTGNSVDTQINAYAIPILNREAIGATTGRIAAVSGATVTSGGYAASLQSAIDQAFHA